MTNRYRIVLALFAAISLAVLTGCAAAPPSGSTVKISAQGSFSPSGPAKAGTPLTLEFGAGSGCTAAVQFKELGIFEDLTDGGGVVNLPALPAGEYPLICQSDMVMGTLSVQ